MNYFKFLFVCFYKYFAVLLFLRSEVKCESFSSFWHKEGFLVSTLLSLIVYQIADLGVFLKKKK